MLRADNALGFVDRTEVASVSVTMIPANRNLTRLGAKVGFFLSVAFKFGRHRAVAAVRKYIVADLNWDAVVTLNETHGDFIS